MCRLIRAGIILCLPVVTWSFPSTCTADGFRQNKLSVRSFQQLQQQEKSIHILYNEPKTSESDQPGHDDEDREEDKTDVTVMESLDVVLERARKRKPSWMLKGVNFLNSPVGGRIAWLTNLDLAFASLALFVGSYGFSVGYILGKWMTNDLQNQRRLRKFLLDDTIEPWQRSLFFQYWPVFLAILLDQAESLLF